MKVIAWSKDLSNEKATEEGTNLVTKDEAGPPDRLHRLTCQVECNA